MSEMTVDQLINRLVITKEQVDEETGKITPADYKIKTTEGYYDQLTRYYREEKDSGYSLPWAKTDTHFSVRKGELTIMTGVSGHGKSMMLSQICLYLMNYTKVLIASLEMKPVLSLHRMLTQKLGSQHPTEKYVKEFCEEFNEKLFISWVGPRGIVAAGIASLFGSKLLKQGVEGAEYITPLVFMIVLGTVLLNATTARLFAKIVGVFLKSSNAILIVGASSPARLIAGFLKRKGKRVIIIDSNENFINQAIKEDLEALPVNIYDDDLRDNIELNDVGYLIAITGNDAVNTYALTNFSNEFGEHGAFRLASSLEVVNASEEERKAFFTPNDDYINLSEAFRENPTIKEILIGSKKEYDAILKSLEKEEKSIPLFIQNNKGIYLITEFEQQDFEFKNITLSYLGKEIVTK